MCNLFLLTPTAEGEGGRGRVKWPMHLMTAEDPRKVSFPSFWYPLWRQLKGTRCLVPPSCWLHHAPQGPKSTMVVNLQNQSGLPTVRHVLLECTCQALLGHNRRILSYRTPPRHRRTVIAHQYCTYHAAKPLGRSCLAIEQWKVQR